MPRESGASSNPRRIRLLLDRPLSRAMTCKRCNYFPGACLVPDHVVTRSEVRLVGGWDIGVVVVVILRPVFRTDSFRNLVGPRHIGQGRRPGRCEDAFIFDRQMQLQELASVLAKDIADR